jgi:hypothetical protein
MSAARGSRAHITNVDLELLTRPDTWRNGDFELLA